jgi:16S rRNA (cytosine967-C5)-methyltransferase
VKFDNQLRHATQITLAYKGGMPLHAWLKNFFREHRQMGSRDRKLLATLVYGFYRLGHAVKDLPPEERILAGLFLCQDGPHELLQYFHPDWNEKAGLPLEEKIVFYQGQPAGTAFRIEDIFPWKSELSEGIDHRAFCLSFLRQPDLFLRIRPSYQQSVLAKLTPVPHEFIPPFTLRLPNGFKVEDYFTPDHQVVIQDYSSQRIASFLQPLPTYLLVSRDFSEKKDISPSRPSDPSAAPGTTSSVLSTAAAAPGPIPAPNPAAPPQPATAPLSFWDACAASGGKSILAHDLYPSMAITVSDIRESILHNLRQRFQQAGIKKYHAFLADLTQGPPQVLLPSPLQASSPGSPRTPAQGTPPFDLILADVPCTGSGTWSRTPEELFYFDPRKITQYSDAQKKIVSHIAASLAPDAWLVYSTCSVYKKENEEVAALLREKFGLKEDRIENIKGYDHRADTMFAARFRR